jgi:predicted MPP superfamily phosphohydrolase
MIFIVILILAEVMTLIVLREVFRRRSGAIFSISVIIHTVLSLWLWKLLFKSIAYNSFFDNPDHIWLLMNMSGTICAVLVPRVILITFHFTGKLIRIRKGGYLKWLTYGGLITGSLIFSIIVYGTFYGRFNFRTENAEIKIKGLNKDLDGLRIIQLSDFHLASFYKYPMILREVIDKINGLKPDLILNTGDFVSFGWREFDSSDTILSKSVSRYGNFAVLGNHDFGTYDPFFTEADRNNNVLLLNKLITSSGYTVLNDTSMVVKIKDARIGLIGIITKGRHPDIVHGDLKKALSGLDSVDLKILLSHDPNQWEEDVVSKTDIDITLSGHTHGMQMGIYTKNFKWSPAKYFYPHWGGLFREGEQYQYVNLGLGVLAIPFRIWMPPEITIITLKRE